MDKDSNSKPTEESPDLDDIGDIERLLSTIKKGLARCGVFEDDLDWMAGIIAEEIVSKYRLIPKS